jgi:hypothetical protein
MIWSMETQVHFKLNYGLKVNECPWKEVPNHLGIHPRMYSSSLNFQKWSRGSGWSKPNGDWSEGLFFWVGLVFGFSGTDCCGPFWSLLSKGSFLGLIWKRRIYWLIRKTKKWKKMIFGSFYRRHRVSFIGNGCFLRIIRFFNDWSPSIFWRILKRIWKTWIKKKESTVKASGSFFSFFLIWPR